MTFPKYLSIKEVAVILRISPKTVNAMANKGELYGHFKRGRMHFFDEEELYIGLKQEARKKTASERLKGRTDNRHNL